MGEIALKMRVGELDPCTEIGFVVNRLKSPHLIFANADLIDENVEIVRSFAWLAPNERDRRALDAGMSSQLFAERYGGAGTGANGGGARCGNIGVFQIKGIGANPLVGRATPPDYAHGGLSLAEAIQEAVWGELLDIALPYGAVRVAAIIATGTPCWWVHDRWGAAIEEKYGRGRELPRGLLVRPAAIRPAHFLRNILFAPTGDPQRDASHDVDRVRRAVAKISQATLPHRDLSDGVWDDNLFGGLAEFAAKSAQQLAAAQARRISHGALSPSNIALDARWMDFGSITGLPFWGSTTNQTENLWDGEASLKLILAELFVQCSKYHPSGKKLASRGIAGLEAVFTEAYQNAVEVEFAELTGFPVGHLQGSAVRRALADTIVEIARSGLGRVFCYGHPDDDSAVGGFPLRQILVQAALHAPSERQHALADALPNDRLRQRFVSAYAALESVSEQAATASGCAASAHHKLTIIRAIKRARSPRFLYRHHLIAEADLIVMGATDNAEIARETKRLISDVRAEAALLLSPERGYESIVWSDGIEALGFDAISENWFVVEGNDRHALPAVGNDAEASIMMRAAAYWGEDWEKLRGPLS